MSAKPHPLPLALAVYLLALAACLGPAAGDPQAGPEKRSKPPATAGDDRASGPSFRILTRQAGPHRIDYEQLVEAGLDEAVPTTSIAMSSRGRNVALGIDDGGDGQIGPGDSLEFVAELLPGEQTYSHPHSQHNVYWLHIGGLESGLLMVDERESLRRRARKRRQTRGFHHWEQDQLMIRLSRRDLDRSQDPELWYWAKLTHADAQPWSIELQPEDLDPRRGKAHLTIKLRGLSERLRNSRETGRSLSDHRIEVRLGDQLLAVDEWDGKLSRRIEIPDLDPARLVAHPLQLSIPQRVLKDDTAHMVDVVMLDWIELSYPRLGALSPQLAGHPLILTERQTKRPVRLELPAATELDPAGWRVYSDTGRRITPAPCGRAGALCFLPEDRETTYYSAHTEHLMAPIAVERDQNSDLRQVDRQADYLMIAHASLLRETRKLAQIHRQRGLTVEVVDAQDVYDEFNHGILDPRALRDFVAHAFHKWQAPAPRFVLLVGDASWDSKNAVADDANYANWTDRQLLNGERFVARSMSYYRDKANSRNLIPAWSFHTKQGHAASDNYFVSVDGEDDLPDLAIGRLPVTKAWEVRGIVAKIQRYLDKPPVGPWRREILWITNDEERFQMRSQRLLDEVHESDLGRAFRAQTIYPQAEEKDNEHHQTSLQQAFDAGKLIVHFYGHGGRNIWRTGPPSLSKNHDLFTINHVTGLEDNERLPLVLSMTCFSAPFDHPSADSIGEVFLRVPDRGAIAVLASSWRTPASLGLSHQLIPRLLQPGTPIGTALMQVKRRMLNRTMAELFNLFGDPAVPLALPGHELRVVESPQPNVVSDASQEIEVHVPIQSFSGQALVEWLDDGGRLLQEQSLSLSDSVFETSYRGSDLARRVRVYVWDEAQGLDALGELDLRLGQAPSLAQASSMHTEGENTAQGLGN